MRDRLIELIRNAPRTDAVYGDVKLPYPVQTLQTIADHLLANCVIALPVKPGDTVFTIHRGKIKEWKVYFVGINSLGEFRIHVADSKFDDVCEFWDSHIGKMLFLTEEDAINELKERKCLNEHK